MDMTNRALAAEKQALYGQRRGRQGFVESRGHSQSSDSLELPGALHP